jgi:hypothetical protein
VAAIQAHREIKGTQQKRLNQLNSFEVCNKLLFNMNLDEPGDKPKKTAKDSFSAKT